MPIARPFLRLLALLVPAQAAEVRVNATRRHFDEPGLLERYFVLKNQ